DRPPRPPLRDPRTEGRLLPPARQGPRRPSERRVGRHRLTDHLRAPRRGPQRGLHGFLLLAGPPKPSPTVRARRQRAPLGATRLRSATLAGHPQGAILNRRSRLGGPLFN